MDKDWPSKNWRDARGEPEVGDWDLDEMKAQLPRRSLACPRIHLEDGYQDYLWSGAWPHVPCSGPGSTSSA